MWKIPRNSDGLAKDVMGEMSWTGCPKENPPPFLVPTGQELEYIYADVEGAWSNETLEAYYSDENDIYGDEYDAPGSDASW